MRDMVETARRFGLIYCTNPNAENETRSSDPCNENSDDSTIKYSDDASTDIDDGFQFELSANITANLYINFARY